MDRREPTTREVIDELVRDLAPVRRFPSTPTALSIVFGAWWVAAALSASLHHPRLDWVTALRSDPWFALAVIGLAVAAALGCLGGVASAVPGREGTVRRAFRASTAGLVLAVLAGVVAVVLGRSVTSAPLAKDAGCFALGVAVGAVPVIALIVLERRGFIQHAARSATVSLAGAFALGALAVQLTCQQPGARHMLVGHVSVPVVMVVLATLPLAWLLSRRATTDPTRRGGSGGEGSSRAR